MNEVTTKLPVSVVIIASNEAKNLKRCLNSVYSWVSEIIVVINDCTDNTQQIAESFQACVIEHPWEGYAAQKNFAYTLATYDWILNLDADEEVSNALKQSIEQFFQLSNFNSYTTATCRRTNRYFQHWLKHTARETHHSILLKKRAVHWEGPVHERLCFQGLTKPIAGSVLHYTEKTVQQTLSKQIKYAQLSAITLREKHTPSCLLLKAIINPWVSFFKHYIIHLGFLDGFAGFYYATINAYYTFLKYTFALEQKNKNE